MVLGVMRIIGIDFVIVLIFYSFNNVLWVLEFIEYLWGLIGLLSNYHNSREALLWAVLARACAVYSSILAMQVIVTPAYLPSQMARSFSSISTVSYDPNLYSVCVEWRSSLLLGASSLLASTSEAHWLASPNSCMSRCLIITPLVGVMSFNHIQISTLDRLSDPSSSCQMAVGTPSGL